MGAATNTMGRARGALAGDGNATENCKRTCGHVYHTRFES
jgi:hypothetical protein